MRGANRRFPVFVAGAIVAMLIVGFVGQRAFAQDQNPSTSSVYHAQVGSWFIGLQGDQPGRGGTLANFAADGSVIVYAVPGTRPYLWIGQWQPTGPLTTTFTIVGANTDANGAFVGNSTLYATNVIDGNGNGFTTTGVIVTRNATGAETGRQDVIAIGSRIQVSALPAAPPVTASPVASPTS
jgi:hypothetical protein